MDKIIIDEVMNYKLLNGTNPKLIIVNKKDFKAWKKEVRWSMDYNKTMMKYYMGIKLIKTKDIGRGTVIVTG
jgi:uncharacterized protein (AIM24 family)